MATQLRIVVVVVDIILLHHPHHHGIIHDLVTLHLDHDTDPQDLTLDILEVVVVTMEGINQEP